MKKSTKGAVAAAAAGVLLLGGAGSLAYWTAEGTVTGGDITAGDLKLSNADCDADWVYAGTTTTVQLFVPGDEITKQCTFDLEATGDNLAAELTAPDTATVTTDPADTSFDVDVAATYTKTLGTAAAVDVADGDTVTSSDDGSVITATIAATIPFGTDEDGTPKVNANDTQDIVATLDDITVTLTQVDPSA
jgi:alternate signal-mediated exported protein